MSGSTSMPSDSRNATNRSYSDSGRSRSATVVNGTPVAPHHAPAWSQLPLCGSAMTVPRPAAMLSRSRGSPTVAIPLTTRSRGVTGRRKTSHQ